MTLNEILKAKGTDVHTIGPDATLADVVDQLVRCNCGSLVVCENDEMIGIITERDILRACAAHEAPLETTPVRQRMSSPVLTAKPEDRVDQVMGLLTKNRIRHLPVVDAHGKLVGMISIGDVVKSQHDKLTMENHYLKEYIQS